ncbi:MAG: diguanylate cyclase [Armatimonas sp.]
MANGIYPLEHGGPDALRQAVETAVKTGDDTALALIDLDYFHNINQTRGREAGDAVLATFWKLLQEAAQPLSAQAFRFGGDEFALLIPTLSLEQAFLKMEALRAQVETTCEHTITIGVAQFPRDGKDTDALLTATDAALGSAKEQGRNTVGLPLNEEMVMKSCYYPAITTRRLKTLAEKTKKKESVLLREALADLLRKYEQR